jgi:MipA family protein
MRLILVLVLLLPAIAFAAAETLPTDPVPDSGNIKLEPLWEIGMGGGATFTPDYPGSNQNHLWAIPFPFAVYRGQFLHSDRRGGTRARILQSASYEINFSAGGGLPSSSGSNDAREGMPDLEWLGELGPRIMFDLYSRPEEVLLRFGFPIRAAFSSNFQHLTDRGFLIAPELLYDRPTIFGTNLDAYALLTVNFSDRRFANYFYGVEPANAKPDRAAYTARAGYLLTDLTLGIVAPVQSLNLKIMSSMTFESLAGSANTASPLFKAPFNMTASMVLIWVFAQSSDKVQSND